MNSLERVRKACRHEQPDCVPVGPFAGFYAARMTGVSLRRYVTDGQAIADAQIALQRATGQDIVVTAADTYYLAEGFGLEVELHENALPTAKGPLLAEPSDVNRLRVPDPRRDGRMPVYLKAVEALSRALGEHVAIRGTGTGPFSIAAYLYGMQRFLMMLAQIEVGEATAEDERRVHQLLNIAADASSAFLKAQLDAGAHIIYLGDSLASADMISPAMGDPDHPARHARRCSPGIAAMFGAGQQKRRFHSWHRLLRAQRQSAGKLARDGGNGENLRRHFFGTEDMTTMANLAVIAAAALAVCEMRAVDSDVL
jgi:uroporphyrinogen-III decarboxylase